MSQLIDEGIYTVHRMFDYQGLCPEGQDSGSSASKLLLPYFYLTAIFEWAVSSLTIFAEAATGNLYDPALYQQPNDQFEDPNADQHDHIIVSDHEEAEPKDHDYEHDGHETLSDKAFDESATLKKTKPEPCDNELFLYKLVHYTDRNVSNSGYNKTMGNCSRPFIVQRVTGSNMILLVINNLCQEQKDRHPPAPDPQQIDYNISLSCLMNQENYPRRLYMSCINRSDNESEIKLCGRGTSISSRHVIPILLGVYSVIKHIKYLV